MPQPAVGRPHKTQGESMTGAWDFRSINAKDFMKRVWRQFLEDDVTGEAAKLAFYSMLALFPLLLFTTALLGTILQGEAMLQTAINDYFENVAPESVASLMQTTLQEVSEGSTGGKLSIGLLVSLWAASRGMIGLMRALNVTYSVEESRKWWKARLVALGLTLGFALLMILALVLVMIVGPFAVQIAERLGIGRAVATTWNVLRWPVLLLFLLFAFNLLYIFAPNLKRRRWNWLMPGTVVGVGLWLAASFGFKIYLSHFNNYSATYGSIGAVIILLVWLYVSGMAILVGAEVNSELEAVSKNIEPKGN
jgi:membrane protein